MRMKSRIFRIRLFHWEYWSFHTIYLPIYPIWLFLCLRARSFFFFAASNPGIKNGGFLGESKKQIYELIPAEFQPKTIFFEKGVDPQIVLDRLNDKQFRYPLIGKPDVGGRGRGVKKLDNPEGVLSYARRATLDFHVQEFVTYEKELGVFYYRFPDWQRGRISGIVGKEFLKVRGDGKRSARELLMLNPRGILQLPELERYHPELLDQVVAASELLEIAPYGNHARGAKFLDDTEKLSHALSERLDCLCRQIPDFYFVRLDIRYRDLGFLEAGKDFSIIEVNGAGSEPTHIYDPGHSIFFAWKEIVRHWIILFKISRANHRLGYPYLSFTEGIRMFRNERSHSKQLNLMKKLQ